MISRLLKNLLGIWDNLVLILLPLPLACVPFVINSTRHSSVISVLGFWPPINSTKYLILSSLALRVALSSVPCPIRPMLLCHELLRTRSSLQNAGVSGDIFGTVSTLVTVTNPGRLLLPGQESRKENPPVQRRTRGLSKRPIRSPRSSRSTSSRRGYGSAKARGPRRRR